MIMNANPIIGPRRVREREEESLADSRDIRSHILRAMGTHTQARGAGLRTPSLGEKSVAMRRKFADNRVRQIPGRTRTRARSRGDVNSLQQADVFQCQNISFSSSSSTLWPAGQRRIDVFSSRDRISGTNGTEVIDEKRGVDAERYRLVLLRASILVSLFLRSEEKFLPLLGTTAHISRKLRTTSQNVDTELFRR